ncbi:MAG TPA: flagellar basal-body rod protein FlgG [Phycisphaerae bacterium]|nr:flagellar basal-body rod protein FlgG [Phycisphaerae bacterium]
MAIIALHSAASGLQALSTQLDVISNNLANANNNGFKSSRVNFEDLIYQYQQVPGTKDELGDTRPTGIAVGLGTRVAGTQLDMAQGAPITTGRQLDVCIEGDGMFQMKVLPSQGNGLAYTRTGSFFINDQGNLVLDSQNGYMLDPQIKVPANTTDLSITTDGRVMATVAGTNTQQQVGQIQLAHFTNPQGLLQIGGNMYQQTDASGPPTLVDPGQPGAGTLLQGAIEASNVDPVTQLVDLIKTQRTFELNSQSIQAADQMLQTVANLRH